jgi:4-amino-4-deoxy-L-arabinose transferase-like glycosyltransferase
MSIYFLGLLIGVLLLNSIGAVSPLLDSTFAPYYASIAKHIVITNDWVNLILLQHDWLDKPHFPFWITALSFKIFGINSYAYVLPGFLFYLLGIYYTYKIACIWYPKIVGIIAMLFTATSLHLMLSSIDVRAEAYLLGQIIPACYYWILFHRQGHSKYLFIAALFSALALMTKGLFVLLPIGSGLISIWILERKPINPMKWILAALVTIIFILPELIALYQQFDMHPNKVIFGHTHVSGIKFFFWDSQFSRFFNDGPIYSPNPVPYHQLFFIETFMWAYLPWCIIFFLAIYRILRYNMFTQDNIYLLTSFFLTFIIFSLTPFQVDHYTNILFPFASIICAKWYYDMYSVATTPPPIYYIQICISVLIGILVIILMTLILHQYIEAGILVLISVLVTIILFKYQIAWYQRMISISSVAISLVFLVATIINYQGYRQYDAGYQIAQYINQQSQFPVVGYDIDSHSLDFNLLSSYRLLDNINQLTTIKKPIYLVLPEHEVATLSKLSPSINYIQMHQFRGSDINAYIRLALDQRDLSLGLTKYRVLLIK